MTKISLKSLIAPSFYGLHKSIKNDGYTHYWLKGGRGGTKSSFIAIEIILGMMKDPLANTMALRKVAEYLHDSVYEQIMWAINVLEVDNLWKSTKSPMELTYIPTGQKIIFRGADKPKKIKSTKLRKGYFKFIWFEEVDEFNGMEEIRMIIQSLMRGGETFDVFYSYNPPNYPSSWVNQEVLIPRDDRIVHHSTYLEVPREWLGQQFIIEAEHLRKVNEKAYNHEYLGEVNGTGGEVFANVKIRKISDEEVKSFDRIKRGLDYGYASDPLSYITMHYNKTRKRLYIFFEIFKVNMSNRKLAGLIQAENLENREIIADSAEPKSNAELRSYGLKVRGVKKYPGSVDYGMQFLSREIEEIIIDPERCPNTTREFTSYSLEKDKDGNWKADYPDKNNHSIDAARYGMEDYMGGGNKVRATQSIW